MCRTTRTILTRRERGGRFGGSYRRCRETSSDRLAERAECCRHAERERERERESVRVRCFSKMEEKYLRKRWGKCPQISRTRLAAKKKKKKKKKKATKENDDRGGPPDENFRLAPGLDRRRALQSGGRSRRAIALERRRCQL